MSEHITEESLNQYFAIMMDAPQDEDIDFINEIEHHAACCDACYNKMEAVRLLLRGFVEKPSAAERFVHSLQPESIFKPVFDIKKSFLGVRLALSDGIQALADTLSDKMHAVFSESNYALALQRGDNAEELPHATNDLLYNDMEFRLAGGRIVSLHCKKSGNSRSTMLLIRANFDTNFVLTSHGKPIPPLKKTYDAALDEYLWGYELANSDYDLAAE